MDQEPEIAALSVWSSDVRSAEHMGLNEVDLPRWETLARRCLETEGARGELTLTFVDNDEMAALNGEYMGQDGPTDVLSFPLDDPDIADPVVADPDISDPAIADPGFAADDAFDLLKVPVLLGDVVIAPAVAAAQFADHAGTYDDELALLVVHGVLHILGHDHAEPDETRIMRERELALLSEHHWQGAVPTGFRQAQPE